MKTNVVNQLFKQKYWIRFELGISGLEEKAYFNEVMVVMYMGRVKKAYCHCITSTEVGSLIIIGYK
ncbi:hypothetical protein [Paenibacillus sp. LHD-38]|uniref:hypothetical protein n=1 Tax=Paenibacillus sp. LHD-38 TaxID=3072143 RepID=UPI00280DF095|nr:hypothetical protein [Paenibacillus sp. LHD-38]MDQ8737009.1 hypothetical protein [Paenibacillus sp. LHD-38]